MDLLGCARTTRTQVTCHLMLTSLGGVDTELTVYASNNPNITQLFDDLGNTYNASEVTVGNLQGNSRVTLLLVSGIPTLAKFQFENVSTNASFISLFKPQFGDGDRFEGDFRDIEF